MIIIGLVLLIVAAVFGLDLIWKNHYTMRSPALFGQTLGIHNAAEFFIIGAVAGAILLLGIAMILADGRQGQAAPRRPQGSQERRPRPRPGPGGKRRTPPAARPRRRRAFLRRHRRRRLEVAAPRYERHLDHKE